ncbi:MAG: DMP19 family protein [Christensenellaceae bacterium]|jgi:hypothetical protein|nr:DMP19 family protein [Christensenellaceae bacterium]
MTGYDFLEEIDRNIKKASVLDNKDFREILDDGLTEIAIYWLEQYKELFNPKGLRHAHFAYRTVIRVSSLHNDVVNGGFIQFFVSSTPVRKVDFIQAYIDVGLPQYTDILKDAFKLYKKYKRKFKKRKKKGIDFNRDIKNQACCEAFKKLDNRYLGVEEEVYNYIAKFIRKNMDVFGNDVKI